MKNPLLSYYLSRAHWRPGFAGLLGGLSANLLLFRLITLDLSPDNLLNAVVYTGVRVLFLTALLMTGLLVGLKGFQEVNVQSYSLLKVSPLTDTQRLAAHLVRAISQTQSWIALSICTLPLLALSAFQHALPWYRIGMPNYRPSGWRGIFPQICAPCPLAGDFLAAAAPGLAFTSLLALGALGLVGLVVAGSLLLAVQGRTSVWVVTASLLMSMLGPAYLYASEQLIPPLAFPYPHLFAMPQLVPAIGLMLSSYLLTALILVAISRKL